MESLICHSPPTPCCLSDIGAKCGLPFTIIVIFLRFEKHSCSDSPYTWLAFLMCGYLLAPENPCICNCWSTPVQRRSLLQPPLTWRVLLLSDCSRGKWAWGESRPWRRRPCIQVLLHPVAHAGSADQNGTALRGKRSPEPGQMGHLLEK